MRKVLMVGILLPCLIICSILFSFSGCTKENRSDFVPPAVQRTGTISGFVSPSEARAVLHITRGYFNGHELLFDDYIDPDQVSGKYVISNVPEGVFVLEAIPNCPDHEAVIRENVRVESNCTTWENYSLPRK